MYTFGVSVHSLKSALRLCATYGVRQVGGAAAGVDVGRRFKTRCGYGFLHLLRLFNMFGVQSALLSPF